MTLVRFPAMAPATNDFDEPAAIELGTELHVLSAQNLTGMSFQAPAADTGCTITVYETTALAVLYRENVDLVAGDNVWTFPTPIALAPNKNYILAIWMPGGGHYTAASSGSQVTEGQFQSGDFNPSANLLLGKYIQPSTGPATPPVDTGYHGGIFNQSANWYGLAGIYDDALTEPPANVIPIARAGADRTVQVNTLVTLNGATSSDSDGSVASYDWSQTSGPAVSLAGSGSSRTFTPTEAGSYVFQLVVTDDDGATSTPDSVVVTVTSTPPPANVAPVANAGVDQSVVIGDLVTLSGTGSTDSDGTIASYVWAQTSGPAATLSGSGAVRTFTPSAAGFYVFQLTVTDNSGATSTDSVTVTVATVAGSSGFRALYGKLEGDSGPTTLLGYLHTQPVAESGGGGGGTSVTPRNVFRVKDQAVGNGTTDDTEAIQAVIDLAISELANLNQAVIVDFEDYEFAVGGPVHMVDRSYGQLHLPFISASEGNPKATVVLRGNTPAQPLLYWDQDFPASAGAVLKSTLSADPSEGGGGAVLAGMFSANGVPVPDDIATFSNMFVVVENLQIQIPHNRGIGGICLKRVAQAKVDGVAVYSDRYRNANMSQLPTNPDMFGLWMPEWGNNAWNEIGSFSAMGLYDCLIGQEHLSAQDLAFVYAQRGLRITGGGNDQFWPDGTQRQLTHGTHIGMLLNEAVNYWIWNDNAPMQLIVDQMGGEGVSNFEEHIHDPNNMLTGQVHFHDIYRQDPVVNGAKRLKVVNDNRSPGRVDEPDLPDTDVALKNPYWRDATIYLAGGNMLGIDIDGLILPGATPMVRVPSGSTITLSYDSPPTWRWVLD